ncbi:hypothetical protein [Pseudomonas protegens]|uniref:hypothetical protein n=1 Tax=Pseudomonas protegens TaxID=380021 RepID=UPI001F194288|nr:hypothetical protein [Pseudomonas protegens]
MSLTVSQLINQLNEIKELFPDAVVVAQSSTRDGYERVSGLVRRQATLHYIDKDGNQQSNFLPVGHELESKGAPIYEVVLLQD